MLFLRGFFYRWISGQIVEYVVCCHCKENFHVDCVINNDDIHKEAQEEDNLQNEINYIVSIYLHFFTNFIGNF